MSDLEYSLTNILNYLYQFIVIEKTNTFSINLQLLLFFLFFNSF